jgi:hypothetical protein
LTFAADIVGILVVVQRRRRMERRNVHDEDRHSENDLVATMTRLKKYQTIVVIWMPNVRGEHKRRN